MAVQPIPDGYHSITPYLVVNDGAAALEFYQKAFGAEELFRMAMPDGRIGHAEIKIGDSPVMLADECPDAEAVSPKSLNGTPVGILLYVEDCDARFEQAVAAGASVAKPLTDQFYGDRSGTVVDPFGHKWTIATHKEDLTPEELEARVKEFTAGQQSG